MKKESLLKKIFVLGIIISTISISAMDLPTDDKCSSQEGLSSSAIFQDIPTEIIGIPSQEARMDFFESNGFVFDSTIRQAAGDELKPKFGLALSGGGMRGYMPAIELKILMEEVESLLKTEDYELLEGKTYKISEMFDCIGGTSIGGILALGIGNGNSPTELTDLFTHHGGEIFSSGIFSSIKSPFAAKYDSTSLTTLLQRKFGDKTISKLETDVIVTACSTAGKPKLFGKKDPPKRDHKLWEIGRCTSAAPTYFPAHPIPSRKKPTEPKHFVDGGLWMNDPSLLVLHRIVNRYRLDTFSLEKIYILSLGTGCMKVQLSVNAGMLHAGSVIDVLMETSSQWSAETTRSFIGNEHYFRINPELEKKINLSDTTSVTMSKLKELAEQQRSKLRDFAKIFLDEQIELIR